MVLKHPGKLAVRSQTLPFQAVFPVLEKSSGVTFATVVPKLSEGFLEDVGRVHMSVGLEHWSTSFFRTLRPSQAQILAPGKQRVTRALDVTPVLTAETNETTFTQYRICEYLHNFNVVHLLLFRIYPHIRVGPFFLAMSSSRALSLLWNS